MPSQPLCGDVPIVYEASKTYGSDLSGRKENSAADYRGHTRTMTRWVRLLSARKGLIAWAVAFTQFQALPLEIKGAKSKLRIREWHDHFGGDVYVRFFRGKDSTCCCTGAVDVPEVPAVFSDTGLVPRGA
jgi:hypothetical protein